MYSEKTNRPASANAKSRANDDFLRRMLGGLLPGNDLPGAETIPEKDAPPSPALPFYPNDGQTRCNGESAETEQTPCRGNCPTRIHAPSLAMVYAPRQCWRELMDPEDALNHGSQFKELILPLEGGGGCREVFRCK